MREMETARLYLRSWKLTDSSSLFKYASDPEVGPRVGWSPHTSIDESEKIIQSVLLNKNNYAICKKEENCIIGSIGFDECETVKGKTEATIGYWIARPFWDWDLVQKLLNRSSGIVLKKKNLKVYGVKYLKITIDQ